MQKKMMALSGVLSVLAWAGSAWAGRPLTVDDADPAGAGVVEAEAGASFERDGDDTYTGLPAGLTYGVIECLEVGVGWGWQQVRSEDESGHVERIDGAQDVGLGAKWQYLGEGSVMPRQALALAANLPAADEDKGLGSGEVDYDVTWIASKTLGERVGLHLNVGYTWVGDPDGEAVGDVLHYGLAADVHLTDSVHWVVEAFAEDERDSDADSVWMGNTGLCLAASDAITLDVAAGTRLAGEAPDLTVTAGLTWAFGAE
jgi:hypothetical protein